RAIRRHVAESLDEAKGGEVSPATLERAAAEMARLFDVRYGGFGSAPKFPHPAAAQFLLARWHDTREDWVREVVEKTLTGMARGGIRDQVGGGFHRYAVDERWIVPHFEKMAYDTSELLHAYLDGYAALGTPLFKRVARGTVDWVLEVLSDHERGAFFTSQDADVQFGDDGDYWTWTVDELKAALPEQAFPVARRVFDVEEGGGMGHVIDRAEPRGLLEDNVHAAAAFLDAYESTGDEAWLTRAITVMQHCREAHWDEAKGGFFDVARDRTGSAYLATPAKP